MAERAGRGKGVDIGRGCRWRQEADRSGGAVWPVRGQGLPRRLSAGRRLANRTARWRSEAASIPTSGLLPGPRPIGATTAARQGWATCRPGGPVGPGRAASAGKSRLTQKIRNPPEPCYARISEREETARVGDCLALNYPPCAQCMKVMRPGHYGAQLSCVIASPHSVCACSQVAGRKTRRGGRGSAGCSLGLNNCARDRAHREEDI